MTLDPRYIAITDLLLGAAHADDRLEGEEKDAVRRLLLEVVGGDALPDALDARIKAYEPSDLDLAACAKALAGDSPEKKRKVLELVAAVFDADGEVDFAEDDYLRELAKALGLGESELSGLVIQYDVEDARAVADVIVSAPPPPPKR